MTGMPTICKCGSAESYHRPADSRDHEYEPRYNRESWDAARRDLLADLTRQIEGLPDVTCHRWHEHTDKAKSNIGISRAAVLKVLRDAEGERRG